jgi:hypothetical protein
MGKRKKYELTRVQAEMRFIEALFAESFSTIFADGCEEPFENQLPRLALFERVHFILGGGMPETFEPRVTAFLWAMHRVTKDLNLSPKVRQAVMVRLFSHDVGDIKAKKRRISSDRRCTSCGRRIDPRKRHAVQELIEQGVGLLALLDKVGLEGIRDTHLSWRLIARSLGIKELNVTKVMRQLRHEFDLRLRRLIAALKSYDENK